MVLTHRQRFLAVQRAPKTKKVLIDLLKGRNRRLQFVEGYLKELETREDYDVMLEQAYKDERQEHLIQIVGLNAEIRRIEEQEFEQRRIK